MIGLFSAWGKDIWQIVLCIGSGILFFLFLKNKYITDGKNIAKQEGLMEVYNLQERTLLNEKKSRNFTINIIDRMLESLGDEYAYKNSELQASGENSK
jgi:hypothetical protein